MNFNKYLSSMASVVKKDDVLTNLDNVLQELTSRTIPVVNTATAAMATVQFKSPEAIGLQERYTSAFKLGRNASMFPDIQKRLDVVVTNLQHVRDLVERTMPPTVSKDAVDRRVVTMLQMVENASFLSRYIRRMVETVVIYETSSTNIYEDYQRNNLTRGEAQYVDDRFGPFSDILLSMSENPKDFAKKYQDIPMVIVDTSGDDTAAVFSALALDPFRLGFIPYRLNPAFHIARWIGQYQVWRHKEAQDDLMRIQKRILLLEEAYAGQSNPNVEKELDILRTKSESLTYKIHKVEEEIK